MRLPLSLLILLLCSPAYGAVAFDNYATSTAGTGDISFDIIPVGTVRGLIVYIICNGASADEITSVTADGTSLSEVTDSPTTNTTGELGSSHCFFLGSSIPAGTLTIAVTTSGTTTTKIAGAVTLTASQDTSVVDTNSLVSNAVSNPSVTLSLGGISCFAMVGSWDGIGNGSIAPLTGWTERLEHDYGNQEAYITTYNTVSTSDVTAGYTRSSDDVALHAIAVRENAAAGGTAAQVILVN